VSSDPVKACHLTRKPPGQFLRSGVGTGEAYLASNGPLAFITAGTNVPTFPGTPVMMIDKSGNVDVSSGLMRIDIGGLSLGGTAPLAVDAPGVTGGRFTVLANGIVGINNPAPTFQLDVNGSIHGTNLNLASGAYIPGQVQTGPLQASSVQINGDTPMSSAPRMTFAMNFPGGWCNDFPCGASNDYPRTLFGSYLVPDRAIQITHISLLINNLIDPSCIPPTLNVYLNNSGSVVLKEFLPTNASTADFVVSPPLSVPAGMPLGTFLFPLTFGCNVGSNGGGDGFGTVQYVMQ
jgi:hypothetical protein